MTRMNAYSSRYELARDPAMAAMLSIIPGLGQLYNGEKRKGMLFLDVAAINFLLLWLIFFTEPIVKAMVAFGKTFKMEPNKTVIESLQAVHLGSPLSIIVLGLVMTFAAYAARDAYDHALVVRRKSIYPECVVEMPEATSGSYLFHFAAMAALLVLALFFVQPVRNPSPVIVFEFVTDQPPVKEKVEARKLSNQNSRDSGLVNKHKPVTPPGVSSSQAQASRPVPQPPRPVSQPASKPAPDAPARQVAMLPTIRPVKAATPPDMLPNPTPQSFKQPVVAPSITPQAVRQPQLASLPVAQPARPLVPVAQPTLPLKTMAASAGQPAPMPVAPVSGAQPLLPAAQPIVQSRMGTAAGAPTPVVPARQSAGAGAPVGPAPIPVVAGAPGTAPGVPAPVVSGPAGQRSAGQLPAAPAATRLSNSRTGAAGTGNSLAVAPATGTQARPGAPGQSGQPGAMTANDNPRGPGSVRAKQVDFGAYMAMLQRRIKQYWFPPRDMGSKRVIVVFKIDPDGHLLNLRLDRPSGSAAADNAALKAVKNAAPFPHLPEGAEDAVD
ncbi:MAG TPA: TonB family protein, partial [Candidatus Obscuribacterales bacterium]